MTTTDRTAADERALQSFLDVNHLDLHDVVADVTVRAMAEDRGFAERARADLGAPSLMVRHMLRDLQAAGGLRAVNVSEFVTEELARRAIVASWPRAERAQIFDRIAALSSVPALAEGA